MTDNKKLFENFVRQIEFDDTPDHKHRNKLEQELLRVLTKQSRHKQRPLKIWRINMKSNMTKLAAAAVIIVAVVLTVTIMLPVTKNRLKDWLF